MSINNPCLRVLICMLTAMVSLPAEAETKEFEFNCGEAAISILGTYDPKVPGAHGFSEFRIKVGRGVQDVDITLGHGYMHFACLENSVGRKMIVFQQYCDGSACHDLDNYGVVDTDTLEILLVPDNSNRDTAAGILGMREAPRLSGHPGAVWLSH